jgi:cytochrome c peroxidase
MWRPLGLAMITLAVSSCTRSAAPAVRSASVAAVELPTSASRAVQQIYRRGLDSLAAELSQLRATAAGPATSAAWAAAVRGQFARARRAYKSVEPWLEFEAPTTASELNGAAVPEAEDDDGVPTPIPPDGFQVLEELLYPEAEASDSGVVRNQIIVMQSLVVRAQAYARAAELTESGVFDAVRSQIARVSVLGLANADSPVAMHGWQESAWSLDAVSAAAQTFATTAITQAPREWSNFLALLDSTRHDLRTSSARPTAGDPLELTRARLIPLGRAWWRLRAALNIRTPSDLRAWRPTAATLFDRDAFDALAFAPSYTREQLHDSAAALGAKLVGDVRLSGDGARSCLTCHVPSRSFTDGRVRSVSRDSARLRNAPTLLNSALQRGQFADARAAFLEDQVADVIANPHEMGGNLSVLARAMHRDSVVRTRFARTFGSRGDSTVTALRIRQAIAAYLRTLSSLDAPYDRYLRGDTAALSADERQGYAVFMGKGKCGTCHFPPLFNGTVPPGYLRSELEVLGTPEQAAMRVSRLSADRGRAAIIGFPLYESAFKTPTLRHVQETAPYMHNGVYRTLEEVIEFYNRGGGRGLGLAVPNQTLPDTPLHLTRRERQVLVAFLGALSPRAGRDGR